MEGCDWDGCCRVGDVDHLYTVVVLSCDYRVDVSRDIHNLYTNSSVQFGEPISPVGDGRRWCGVGRVCDVYYLHAVVNPGRDYRIDAPGYLGNLHIGGSIQLSECISPVGDSYNRSQCGWIGYVYYLHAVVIPGRDYRIDAPRYLDCIYTGGSIQFGESIPIVDCGSRWDWQGRVGDIDHLHAITMLGGDYRIDAPGYLDYVNTKRPIQHDKPASAIRYGNGWDRRGWIGYVYYLHAVVIPGRDYRIDAPGYLHDIHTGGSVQFGEPVSLVGNGRGRRRSDRVGDVYYLDAITRPSGDHGIDAPGYLHDIHTGGSVQLGESTKSVHDSGPK